MLCSSSVNHTGFTERVTKITTNKAESEHDVMTNYTEVWGINIMAEDIFKNQYISLCYLVRRLYKEVFTNKNKEDYCWGVCTVPVSNMNLCWLAINLCLCSLGSVQRGKKRGWWQLTVEAWHCCDMSSYIWMLTTGYINHRSKYSTFNSQNNILSVLHWLRYTTSVFFVPLISNYDLWPLTWELKCSCTGFS